MQKIVYYVAVSLDGYICDEQRNVSDFIQEGAGVEAYHSDLQLFDTVIMGRHTYEFGYRYGLKPGQPAYPGMRHYIFSDKLKLENTSGEVQVVKPGKKAVAEIRRSAEKDIYLCGGGILAGWFLRNNMIDELKLKLNPVVLGSGVKLFENLESSIRFQLVGHQAFADGMIILTYRC
ncbi:MAG: dihydrofolate reductase family protein [Cyclobacteriaceae bacterium]